MAVINLSKNRVDLETKRNEVINKTGSLQWVCFGYEGNSTALRVIESGDTDLDDAIGQLDETKLQYLYCRVIEPNSGLAKYVLINWQGEGVPEQRRSQCARHIEDVKRFIGTVHVTVNASTESQLSADAIRADVTRASGALYTRSPAAGSDPSAPRKPSAAAFTPATTLSESISNPNADRPASPAHKRVYGPSEPVGTRYQRPDAKKEIQSDKSKNFWEQSNKEEEQRRVERQHKQQQERLARLSVASGSAPAPPLDEKPTMRNKQNGDSRTNVTVSATITLDTQAEPEPDAGTSAAGSPNSNSNSTQNPAAKRNVQPVEELVSMRNSFWQLQDEEAERARKEELRQRDEERRAHDREVIQRELEAAKQREQQERERIERIRTQKAFEEESERRTQQQQQQEEVGRKRLSAAASGSAPVREPPEVEADREEQEKDRAQRADVERRRRQEEMKSLVRQRKESFDQAPSGEENRADQLRRQRQEELRAIIAQRSSVTEVDDEERERRNRSEQTRRQREEEMKRLLTSNRDSPERDGSAGPQHRADEIRRQRQEEMRTLLVSSRTPASGSPAAATPSDKRISVGASHFQELAAKNTPNTSNDSARDSRAPSQSSSASGSQWTAAAENSTNSNGPVSPARTRASAQVTPPPTATLGAIARSSFHEEPPAPPSAHTSEPLGFGNSQQQQQQEPSSSSPSVTSTIGEIAKASDPGAGDDLYANVLSLGLQNNHAAETTKSSLTFEPAASTAGRHTATALYDYNATDNDELSFFAGDSITNVDMVDDNWWHGSARGKTGLFPANYVQVDGKFL